jgi:thiol:disulfide interchange protein
MLQPPYVIFIVYAFIGVGMSFPYIVLSMSRRLAKMLPKPGPWMDDFKKMMGFLLLGFAVYLLLGLPGDYVVPAVLFCVAASLAVTVYGRFAPWVSSFGRKAVMLVLALGIGVAGFYLSFMVVYPSFSEAEAEKAVREDVVWQEFSADSLLRAHAEGRHAIVDFTANWCMNCQYNTIMVLTKKRVTDLIREKNALAMVADMTMPNPVLDSLLRNLGSRSIPFLAVFPGNNPRHPVVMRDVLTAGKVVKSLKDLR